MALVLIGIGSNLEAESALGAAVAALKERFGRVECSSVYRSPAVGGDAADYLNMVAMIDAGSDVGAVRAQLAAIEMAVGRTRVDPSVCRLDLDLLMYGSRVDAAQRLPRAGLYKLPFVLVPLAEIAPGLAHPLTGERCAAALAAAPPAPELEYVGGVPTL